MIGQFCNIEGSDIVLLYGSQLKNYHMDVYKLEIIMEVDMY